MSHPRTTVDLRDQRAANRDDAADRRDGDARGRDAAAERRDAEAGERDDERQASGDLTARIERISRQVLGRLARIENAAIDPDDWPDLTPAALARLDAHTAEQRRLAGLDRAAVTALLDQLHHELGEIGDDRHAAALQRDASSRDRHSSADNRHDSGQDRDLSAQDRGQATIEREQVDLRDLPPDGDITSTHPSPGPGPSPGRRITSTERAIAGSRRRISDSGEPIEGGHTAQPAGDDIEPSPESGN